MTTYIKVRLYWKGKIIYRRVAVIEMKNKVVAVHPAMEDKTRWVITHLATGLRISPFDELDEVDHNKRLIMKVARHLDKMPRLREITDLIALNKGDKELVRQEIRRALEK